MDFAGLTEEQKAKVKACTSPEELLAMAQEEGYELTDEQLESISGGKIVWANIDMPPAKPGDVRDDIAESQMSDAFKAGEIRGDELD